MSHVNFARTLRAAAHKGEAPALLADSIADAAHAYALNGGAKNMLLDVIGACTTTEKGKDRVPAAGTLPGLILSAMNAILLSAEAAGARPAKGGADMDARRVLADAYAQGQRDAFVIARDTVESARKDASAVRAAAKKEAVATSAAAKASAEQVTGDDEPLKADQGADVASALTLLARMTDDQLSALAGANSDAARRLSAVFAQALQVGEGKAAQTVQRVRSGRAAAEFVGPLQEAVAA